MVMGDVGVAYVKAGQHNLFFSIFIAFYIPISNGRFYVLQFVVCQRTPMYLPLLSNDFIYNRFIIGIWYFYICLSPTILWLDI